MKAEPVWDSAQHAASWRAVWGYSTKRAVRDNRTLTLEESRAKVVVAGERTAKAPRFVKKHKVGAVVGVRALSDYDALFDLTPAITDEAAIAARASLEIVR